MRRIKNPWAHIEGYDCFGCCPGNPIGVHLEFFEDGEDIVTSWMPGTHYQGWVDTVHGGILCTLLDETAAWVVFRKLQTSGVTTRMDIRYRKPVMTTDGPVEVRARLSGRRHSLATVDAVLKNSRGEVCVEATATYFAFDGERARGMGFTSCDLEPGE